MEKRTTSMENAKLAWKDTMFDGELNSLTCREFVLLEGGIPPLKQWEKHGQPPLASKQGSTTLEDSAVSRQTFHCE